MSLKDNLKVNFKEMDTCENSKKKKEKKLISWV